MANIYVDCDGAKSTGVDWLLIGPKMKKVEFQQGWDYIVKLTYSAYVDTGRKAQPMLISQVEKFEKVKYGHKTKLVDKHRNNRDDPSYVGAGSRFQELRIPFQILDIKPPTDIAFLFMEGNGRMSTDYDKHCQLLKTTIKK